jgi:hypothetical protein
MAVLGDLLAAARNSSGRFRDWLAEADSGLAAEVDAAAARAGLTPTGFVRAAVSDFSRFASEEDWATLVSALRDSEDPGTVCLMAMVDWRLTAPGCSEHGHGPNEQGMDDGRPVQRSA